MYMCACLFLLSSSFYFPSTRNVDARFPREFKVFSAAMVAKPFTISRGSSPTNFARHVGLPIESRIQRIISTPSIN